MYRVKGTAKLWLPDSSREQTAARSKVLTWKWTCKKVDGLVAGWISSFQQLEKLGDVLSTQGCIFSRSGAAMAQPSRCGNAGMRQGCIRQQ